MSNDDRLPIKVVPPLEADYVPPPPGGGPKKLFVSNLDELQEIVLAQIGEVNDYFAHSFARKPKIPAVMRVRLRKDAAAKSHRPTKLFSDDSCPIIGSEGLGGLLVSITPKSLQDFSQKVKRLNTHELKANLSTIENISPFRPRIDIPEGLPAIKVKLIKHRMFGFDDAIENDFRATLLSFGVSNSQEVNYGPGLKIFSLPSPSRDLLDDLTRFVGLHTLSGFPIYYPVRTQALPIGAPQTRHYPLPMPDASYPVIGIIDSGIQRGIPFLEPWIVGRENYVPHNRAHYGHGTFVAGLATYARRLNHHDPRFPSCSSKILDVAVMSSDGLSEDMLLTILEDVLPRYPQVKYWNISLGTNEPISYDLFSDFAVGLDRLQREYDVTFVLAAGNHQSFMSAGHNNTIEVLCAPADSVRSIVVGAVAHTATASSLSSMEEVAPFSRRGPGPVYLPKPDLSHYGGNCDSSGACRQSGVVSVDHNGMLAEDIGTSFAAPLIATLAANLSETIVGGASKNLTKALLIHAAAMRSEVTEPEALHERGFGVPPDLNEILRCEAWNCTMIFEAPMRPGNEYRKIDFPMARSLFLENGKIRADILMTLVYDPELDASFGSEYCRTNIEASLGTLRRGKDGKWVHKKEVPEDPKLTGSAYEQDLVEGGFKWSPVKVYRRKIARGIQGERWQLVLSLLDRGGHKTYAEQPAALIITIADPAKRAPVYNETVAMMNRLGWGAQNLAISQRVQI